MNMLLTINTSFVILSIVAYLIKNLNTHMQTWVYICMCVLTDVSMHAFEYTFMNIYV